ncbi:MAG: TetR/AcrR family transcriptional regulator [Flavipsychrobacter sp.]
MKKQVIEKNSSTEERIKEAARKVFLQKGYAATRTRDIAEEAGFNLALLNYYFRSKEKLFDIIMMETLQDFLKSVKEILNDTNLKLEEKLEQLVAKYIDALIKNPEMPLFIINALRNDPKVLAARLEVHQKLKESHFMKQIREAAGNKLNIHPLQLIMNLMGMIVFPFIAKPIVQQIGSIGQQEFNELMEERKKLIPIWVHAVLTTSIK